MNTVNMFVREKVNKLHLDEMQREAQSRHTLRLASQSAASKNAGAHRDNPSLLVVRFTRWFWSRPSQDVDGA